MASRQLRLRRVGTRLVMVSPTDPAPPEPPKPKRSPWFMSKAELVALARSRGLDTSGSRRDLIGRLV